MTVDRSGLKAGSYAGNVLVQSGTASAVVTVFMRFADVSGNITGPAGQILPQSAGASKAVSPGASYVPGQVLMKVDRGFLAVQGLTVQSLVGRITPQALTPQAVQSAAVTIAQAHGLSVKSLIAPASPWVVLGTNGQAVPEVASELRSDARVGVVQPNYLLQLSSLSLPVKTAGISAQSLPSDPLFKYQWDMSMLGMPSAWDVVTGSKAVVVAVVDSGVMSSHPDLRANIPYAGYDFVLNQPGAVTPLSDGEYHGTHVAGIIGAVGDNGIGTAGMNWRVSILPVRVCDANGCPIAAVTRGIEYAAGLTVYNGNGILITPPAQARVINLSLGAAKPDPAIENAVALAAGNGTVVVAASGNDVTNCPNPPTYAVQDSPSAVDYPAAYPEAIAVGSVDYDEGTNTFAASCFSNGGTPTGGQGVSVAAPGGFLFNNDNAVPLPGDVVGESGWAALGVVSTWWDNTTNSATYASLVGTSMATPHVSGLAALMLAENPGLTPTNVKLILENTAIETGGFNNYLGYGLISPLAAINEARSYVTAKASDFIVQLVQGGAVVEQTHADAGGDFTLINVPLGTYTVVAGNYAISGVLAKVVGKFYGQVEVTVGGRGDVSGVGLNVKLQ